jgi:hypothetical protein
MNFDELDTGLRMEVTTPTPDVPQDGNIGRFVYD